MVLHYSVEILKTDYHPSWRNAYPISAYQNTDKYTEHDGFGLKAIWEPKSIKKMGFTA